MTLPFCQKCGAEVPAGQSVCPNCHTPLPSAQAGGEPTPWMSALILDEGEKVLQSWRGDHEVPEMQVINNREQQVKVRKHGFLVLTSRKLVFVEERGVFGKSYHVSVTISLGDIEGISMGGWVSKYVSISNQQGENIFHIQGVNSEQLFPQFKSTIEQAMGSREKEIEAQKEKERVQINLDFSFLKDYMTKGGLSVQAVKCPQCGAPISLPDTGSTFNCPYCGTPIYAQDIMSRVKQLIG